LQGLKVKGQVRFLPTPPLSYRLKMMREIREKLSEKYWKHPELLKQEMQKIREKYSLKINELTAVK
jgi:hypothetical protein